MYKFYLPTQLTESLSPPHFDIYMGMILLNFEQFYISMKSEKFFAKNARCLSRLDMVFARQLQLSSV